MRTITKTLYLFSELTEELQKAAYEKDYFNHSSFCSDEILNTIKKFEKIFGVKLIRYEVDAYSHWCRWDFDQYSRHSKFSESENTISGIRLAAYVWNNFIWRIEKGKYYSTPGKWIDNKYYYKCRYSSVTKSIDNCPLTGVCWDCDILDPIDDCIHYKKSFSSFEELIGACFESIFLAWEKELEYENSFDYYKDMAEANEYEYDEYGNRI